MPHQTESEVLWQSCTRCPLLRCAALLVAAAPLPQTPDSDAQKLGCGKPATGHGARDVDTCALTRVDCRWYNRMCDSLRCGWLLTRRR